MIKEKSPKPIEIPGDIVRDGMAMLPGVVSGPKPGKSIKDGGTNDGVHGNIQWESSNQQLKNRSAETAVHLEFHSKLDSH